MLVDLVGVIIQKAVRREELAEGNALDPFDVVQRAAEREVTVRRIESDFNRLQDIRQALDRLKDGSYGSCICCHREIGIKRLRSVPWAAYCTTCQESADREDRQPEEDWFLQYV